MIGKVNRLPVETQKALQQFACLGNSAEIKTLSTVCGTSEQELHSSLWEAVRLEYIRRFEDSYNFGHDRVQEAAYSLIPEQSRAEAHLRIGRILRVHTPADKLEERIFEIVNQSNRGTALITSRAEREELAELNLIAGRRAEASTAYASALKYLVAGAALLGDDRWERRHELIFTLELHRAECEFLTGELAAAEERLTMLSSRVASTVELATVACLREDLYTTLDQSDRAVAVCLDYLRHLGVEWAPHPTEEEARCEYERIWSQLGSRAIEELVELPLMSDPASIATLDVLTKVLSPALFTDPNLASLAVCRAVNLSLEHGNSDGSCSAYVWLGMIAGPHFGNYKAGFRFGRLGYELVEKPGLKRFQARTFMNFGSHVMPWTKHVRACRDLVRRAFEVANKTGDLCFAAYSCNNVNTNLLAAGDPLVEVQGEAEKGLAFAKKVRFGFVIDLISVQVALVRTLRGLTPIFGSLNDEEFDETKYERHLTANPVLALPECWYFVRKTPARFVAGDYGSAVDASLRAQRLLWTSPSLFETAEYHFYGALSRAACCDSAFPDRHRQHFEALAAHHRQLEIWAENCPENFKNRAALVGAEIARIQGRELDAQHLYEQAIRSSNANGFVQNEALANELAARFYMARGFEKIAYAYLRDARYNYVRWGAAGKVRQLDKLYPQLKADEQAAAPTSTIRTPIEHLDFAALIKVLQTISREIVLEKLIDTLMRTVIEQAGAERGLLILPRDADLRIEAEATTSGDTIAVRLQEALLTEDALPQSVVRYALRTHESVILGDASVRGPFSADSYVRQHQARSLLCLPLINQAKLVGLLYLENNLSPDVFTPTRIAALDLLASQAAISLENTYLYRDLQERESKIRRLVDANIIGVVIWDLQGEIVEANEAFLQMLGYAREDLVSRRVSWVEITPPELRHLDQQAIVELKTTGIARPFQKEYFRKDGTRVPVLVGAAMFKSGGNEGVAFVVDLTEQRRSEEALRRSKAYLAQAQRMSRTGHFWWRVPTGELIWSEELYRIFGYDHALRPSAELVSQRVHPEDRDTVEKMVDRVAREAVSTDFEHRLLMPDGSVKHLHIMFEVITDNLESREFVGTVMDVTARKQAEEELRKAQAELAHVARITTLGELAASIAHEISQPLGAVVNSASACLRWLAAHNLEEARQSASRVVQNGQRAGEILKRIRALVQKMPPQQEWVDINETITEVIAMTSSEVQRNHVSLETEFANHLPFIRGDRIQLQQVLLNLIINAVEAMSRLSGGPRQLRVSSQEVTEVTDESNDCTPPRYEALSHGEATHILIAIRDSGSGMDPKDVERIFDAFYTTKQQGLGMGLAISRSIVEAHGGRLWAANTGQGAIFQLALPIGDAGRA
jgi:PAS domain S-box-containing protein